MRRLIKRTRLSRKFSCHKKLKKLGKLKNLKILDTRIPPLYTEKIPQKTPQGTMRQPLTTINPKLKEMKPLALTSILTKVKKNMFQKLKKKRSENKKNFQEKETFLFIFRTVVLPLPLITILKLPKIQIVGIGGHNQSM